MIEEGQRAFACGITGTGKSRLGGYLFATYAGQRLFIDVNDDYELGPAAIEEGACTAREPGKIDWSKRSIRYVPSSGDQDEFEALYAAIIAHVWPPNPHPMFVHLDESEGPTSQHKAPPSMNVAVGQGRKKDLTHSSASLRPFEVFKKLHRQAEHLFAFYTTDDNDLQLLARRMGVTVADLIAAMGQLDPDGRALTAGENPHGFIYHRLGSPQPTIFPPLSDDKLKLTARHIVMP